MFIAMNIIIYIFCLSSLDISSSKKWFIYINQSVQTSTQQGSSDMAEHLTALRHQSRLLKRWCNLPPTSDIDANNILDWTPCGSVQYVTMQMRNVIEWLIKVNPEFVIDIYFHVFHIDASGELCPHSAVIVYGMYVSPMFCGKRKPWSELVDYHKALIQAQQIDVIKPMQLAFTYSIFDPIDMRERVLQSKANKITMKDKPRQSLTYDVINKLAYLQIWYLEAPIGKVIVVTSSIPDVLDHVSIFEGFGKHHPANNGVLWNMTAKLINYYVATIYLYTDMVMGSMDLHALTFWHLNLTPQLLMSSSIQVHNFDSLYYKLFSIKTKLGSFPNVSFQIKRFDGWNEGGCTYGGFLFKQFLNNSQLEPQTLGPYCTLTEPNHPITNTEGLDYLVFGESEVGLIIYANGPLYTLDIEVVVSESSCVGVVSPIWLCSFSMNEINAKRVVKFTGYSVMCESSGPQETRQLVMNFVNISQCIIIQSIGNETTETFSFDIIAHIHFRLTMKLKKNLLLPHQDSIYSNWGIIYKQDNEKVVSVLLNKTTVLSRQHISFVSLTPTPFYRRMYYTYSLLVVPRNGTFSCVDTEMYTHKLTDAKVDLKYVVQIQHNCGAGIYNARGNYLFWFTAPLITPQMLFIQVTTSPCQHSNVTHDVFVACPDLDSCYAVDLLHKVFYLYSTLMKTKYRYERNLFCSTFTFEYNFVRYNIIATMLPRDFQTIYVRMFTNQIYFFNI